jgi:general stress protein YciG
VAAGSQLKLYVCFRTEHGQACSLPWHHSPLLKSTNEIKIPGVVPENPDHPGEKTTLANRRLTMTSDRDRHSSDRSGGESKRGFASMDEGKQREIASQGGKAAHQKGTAHEFTSEEAREAGRKGGQAAHEKGTAHEFDSEEARAAGRKGGHAAHEKGTAHEFSSEEAREAGKKGGESRGRSHSGDSSSSSSSRGGSSAQHAKAGGQSHKNH